MRSSGNAARSTSTAQATRYLPELAATGKGQVTIRHLLTHTAGLPNADGILQGTPWRRPAPRTWPASTRRRSSTSPGQRAGYHAAAGMSLLGEIVADRVSGVPFDRYVREREIFLPLAHVTVKGRAAHAGATISPSRLIPAAAW